MTDKKPKYKYQVVGPEGLIYITCHSLSLARKLARNNKGCTVRPVEVYQP